MAHVLTVTSANCSCITQVASHPGERLVAVERDAADAPADYHAPARAQSDDGDQAVGREARSAREREIDADEYEDWKASL